MTISIKKMSLLEVTSKNHKDSKEQNIRGKTTPNSLYTRKKEDVPKENKSESKKTGKDVAGEKEYSSLSKDQKKKLKKDMVKVSAFQDSPKEVKR